MFKRTLLKDLKNWSERQGHKPLVLRGARQVGKTSLVNLFSATYDQYIYLNLDKKEDLALFSYNLDIQRLFEVICLHKRIPNIEGKTLLFIDEIQNSPQAIILPKIRTGS